MRSTAVLLWIAQFYCSEFYVDVVIERFGRICHRMYTSIVSANFWLYWFIQPSLYRVTLYAEFLPTKQRAKCVVLLDVSLCGFLGLGKIQN